MRKNKLLLTSLFILLASLLMGFTPARAWDADMHFHATYYLARYAGICDEVALKMATLNLNIDKTSATGPMGEAIVGSHLRRLYHFATDAKPNRLQDGADAPLPVSALGRLLNLNIGNYSQEFHGIGSELLMTGVKWKDFIVAAAGLHVLWDNIGAHIGYLYTTGHAEFGHHPDRPWNHIKKFPEFFETAFYAITMLRSLLPPEALDQNNPNSKMSADQLFAKFAKDGRLIKVLSNNTLKDPRYVKPNVERLLKDYQKVGYINSNVPLANLFPPDNVYDGTNDVREVLRNWLMTAIEKDLMSADPSEYVVDIETIFTDNLREAPLKELNLKNEGDWINPTKQGSREEIGFRIGKIAVSQTMPIEEYADFIAKPENRHKIIEAGKEYLIDNFVIRTTQSVIPMPLGVEYHGRVRWVDWERDLWPRNLEMSIRFDDINKLIKQDYGTTVQYKPAGTMVTLKELIHYFRQKTGTPAVQSGVVEEYGSLNFLERVQWWLQMVRYGFIPQINKIDPNEAETWFQRKTSLQIKWFRKTPNEGNLIYLFPDVLDQRLIEDGQRIGLLTPKQVQAIKAEVQGNKPEIDIEIEPLVPLQTSPISAFKSLTPEPRATPLFRRRTGFIRGLCRILGVR